MKRAIILSLIFASLCTVTSCKKSDKSNLEIGTYTKTWNGVEVTMYMVNTNGFEYRYTLNGNKYDDIIDFTEVMADQIALRQYGRCISLLAKYKYTYADGKLTFTVIADPCSDVDGNRSDFIGGTWTKIF